MMRIDVDLDEDVDVVVEQKQASASNTLLYCSETLSIIS